MLVLCQSVGSNHSKEQGFSGLGSLAENGYCPTEFLRIFLLDSKGVLGKLEYNKRPKPITSPAAAGL